MPLPWITRLVRTMCLSPALAASNIARSIFSRSSAPAWLHTTDTDFGAENVRSTLLTRASRTSTGLPSGPISPACYEARPGAPDALALGVKKLNG